MVYISPLSAYRIDIASDFLNNWEGERTRKGERMERTRRPPVHKKDCTKNKLNTIIL